ncbi:MAG: glycogen synthase GlgA [Ruminococcaceae bacterium]|nr:glycogen synthase GlgA [Oscillospiraceae bacterium]
MKKILFVGAEVMPFAATGGLGDVMGSLPAALAREGADVRVIMPLYGQVKAEWRAKMKDEAVFNVDLAWRSLYCGIKSLKKDGVIYYFIDNEYYFKRDALYGSFDDGERFAYFSKAVLESLSQLDFYPDVLHAHDWQAALSVVYLNTLYRTRAGYESIRSVFTIHNIEYQGQYNFGILGDVFGLGVEHYELLDFSGCINLMKAAIVSADTVSTVSPRYAEEICTPTFGHGLDGILRENRHKLCGILNGIDYRYYDPAKDPVIPVRYNWRTRALKCENKLALQSALGLPARRDVPMMAVITRLVAHKGLDIMTEILSKLVGESDVQLVVLGCGEERFEHYFTELARCFPDKVSVLLKYDRDLAKQIYAASDIFLMPSRSEPCGLSQMIASRYGSIPVVRETGGLYDSIKGYWEEGKKIHGNGFTFAGYSGAELYERVGAALSLWRNEEKRQRLIGKIMRTDFSWAAAARDYLAMYDKLN